MKLVLHSVLLGMVFSMLLFPTISSAAMRNAGLINGIWFSINDPVEGTNDSVYAGVFNQASDAISGTISFASDGLALGTSTFSVAPDQIGRVGITRSFTAGSHAISARIMELTDAGTVSYTELTERILVVSPKPAAPQILYRDATTTNTAAQNSTSGLGSVVTVSSTPNGTLRSTASVVNSLTASVASVATPLIRSVTTSRDKILGTVSTTTPQSSAFDVVSPSKNLFDVSLAIAGQAGTHSLWDSIRAFLLSILDWVLYCIIPIICLIGIISGIRWFSHRTH